MPERETALVQAAPSLSFEVALAPPDLGPWREGNTGVAGVTSYAAESPGPHAVLVALVHGNEFAGAIALKQLLDAGLRPVCGRLTFVFANLAAFDRFDARNPTISRFADEDFNRLWDPAVLADGRHSYELARARDLLPVVDSADYLLDLHSMLWPSDPLILCGAPRKGCALAARIGVPPLMVADSGHAAGRRLIDYKRFAGEGAAAAVLLEAGQHWQQETVALSLAATGRLLRALGMVASDQGFPDIAPQTPRFARVTETIMPQTGNFSFVQPFRGGEVIAAAGTVIAMDGETAIATKHDDCLLVMPSLRASRGHTAVRLARFICGE